MSGLKDWEPSTRKLGFYTKKTGTVPKRKRDVDADAKPTVDVDSTGSRHYKIVGEEDDGRSMFRDLYWGYNPALGSKTPARAPLPVRAYGPYKPGGKRGKTRRARRARNPRKTLRRKD